MSRRRKSPDAGVTHKLRVGFVTPGLGVGGAERWVVSLAKHFSSNIKVSGILAYCVTDPLSPEAGRICPLYGPWESCHLAAGSDVIIAWGWEHLQREFPDFKGRMIGVSHASPVQDWHCRVCSSMEKYPNIELLGVSARSLDVWQGPHTGVYVPNGAEVDRCTPRMGRRATREMYEIPQDVKVALFLSRIAPEKRPEMFAEAVLSLPDNWYGIVAGSDIHRISEKLPRSKRLKILPAVDAPGDLLAASDAYVLASTSEAHPIALTEAWLADVPTIYCDWPFASQIRKDHGRNLGTVIPVKCDAEMLAQAIFDSQNPNSIALSQTARRVAWENYTASAMAGRWEQIVTGPALANTVLPSKAA